MTEAVSLDQNSLNQLFIEARSFSYWQDSQPLSVDIIHQLYDLLKMGPTAFNCQPGRYIFLTSQAAKDRLIPSLAPGNVQKVTTAPAVVIIASDSRFADYLPEIYPHSGVQVQAEMETDTAQAAQTAFRNSSLQGAYLILAARALGLDCGPMSGFDNDKLDREFFADGRFKSNFICSLGIGDQSRLHPRSPRFDFEQVCQIL